MLAFYGRLRAPNRDALGAQNVVRSDFCGSPRKILLLYVLAMERYHREAAALSLHLFLLRTHHRDHRADLLRYATLR